MDDIRDQVQKDYLLDLLTRMQSGSIPIQPSFDHDLYEDYVLYCHVHNVTADNRRSFLKQLTKNGFRARVMWNSAKSKPMAARNFVISDIEAFLAGEIREKNRPTATVSEMIELDGKKFMLTIKVRAV
jgi:hypothetical protein